MTEPSGPTPPLDYMPAPLPKPRRWGTVVAWVVILACVAVVMGANLAGARRRPAPPAVQSIEPQEPNLQLLLSSRYAVGVKSLFGGAMGGKGTADPAAQLVAQVRQAAVSRWDKLRAVAVVGEVQGKEAAVAALDPSPFVDWDVRQFRTIYTLGPDAISVGARRELIDDHGWFGELALSVGKPDTDPLRREVVAAARRTVIGMFTFFGVAALGGLTGFGLLVFAVVRLIDRRVRLAYSAPAAVPAGVPPLPPFPPVAATGYPPLFGPAAGYLYPPAGPYAAPPVPVPKPRHALTVGPLPEPPGAGTGPFLEAFAWYLALQVGLGVAIYYLLRPTGLWAQWLLLPAILFAGTWPRLRGVSWAEVRRGLGWHAGRGVAREIGAGLLGYLGGLPVAAAGMVVTFLLVKWSGAATPTHPIQNQIGKGLAAHLQLYALACVWAPVVEETMFRGALFHHLRHRLGWILSAGLVALIFAAIHPQGWAAIPALGSLAVVFAGLREWRGSILAPATAHALNNFVVTTLLIVTLG